ncbi:MAG: ABC transporter substrate-binding protein, partial [Alphaproteobacteria bacterium]|nr:ABC transporter substrate-binding protein [Alphaproteobacteria bacterium]
MRQTLVGLAFATLAAGAAAAQTVVWSSAGDILTFDPQAQSVGIDNAALNQVYEPLIGRGIDLSLEPGLAMSWRALDATTWEFKLRPGVRFHDGAPLTADDVVFTIKRAKAPTSDYRPAVASIAVDPLTVHLKTSGPSPILPHWLTTIFVMNKAWAEKNNAVNPQNFKDKEESFAARNANGTGPFMLKERTPEVRTVMTANPNYWDRAKYPASIQELEYQPVRAAATRVAGLVSRKINFVLDPPVQDLDHIEKEAGLKVTKTAEVRTIFLGFDVARDELLYADVTGKNPFKDIRVRRAVYQAINNDAVQSRIMRGLSQPAGSIIPPDTNGYAKELDTRLPYDPDSAKKLLTDAGYPNGFKVTLECTNNRYLNDEAIRQAIV